MTRLVKIALVAAGHVIGLPLFGLAIVLIGGNTGAGRHLIARAVADLSGGTVAIDGLSGRFPDALRIRHIAVRDGDGTWLTIDRARLEWSPLRLIHGEVKVETLAADHVAIARLPQRSSSSGTGAGLPLSVSVDAVGVDRLDLAAAVAGIAASLRVTGNLAVATSQQGRLVLAVERLDGEGSYSLDGSLSADRLAARITVSEPADGLVSNIAGLPDLGPLSVTASLEGPRAAENLRFQVAAGPLKAEGRGKFDLIEKAADLDLTATAPPMSPRPDLGWQSARLDAHLHGPLTSPAVTGHLDIEALQAGDNAVRQIAADIEGENGAMGLTALAAGLRIARAPELFAAAPVELHARTVLNAAQRPVTFTLSHPLLAASGEIDLGGAPTGSVTVTIPALAPYAAVAGSDIAGDAALTVRFTRPDDATAKVDVDGSIRVTGGAPAVAALVGDEATLSLSGSLHDGDVTLGHLAVDGKAFKLSAKGAKTAGTIDLDWHAALSDLAALSTTVAGTLSADGHLSGSPQNLAASAQLTGEAAIAGFPKENFTASLALQGFPDAPSGNIASEGRFAGAPFELAGAAQRESDGTLALSLDRLQWKSVGGEGRFTLAPGKTVPLGHLRLHMARLADLAALTGVPITGSIDAQLDTLDQQNGARLRFHAAAQQLGIGAGATDRLTVDADIADPTTRPNVTATVAVDGFRQGGTVGGNARLTANGPLDSLGLRLTSDLRLPQGPATLSAAATARRPQRDLQLSSLDASYAGETMRLLGAARLDLANGLAVDSLRLGIGGATVALAGRLTPRLALTVSVRDVTPGIAKPLLPDFRGTGSLTLNGELRGTLPAPEGTLRLTGRGLHVATGGIGGLPAADIDATATLNRDAARLDARLTAGSQVRLALAGTAPLQPAKPLALHLTGNADLAMLDPLLTPNGRSARGQAAIDLALGGTIDAPRPTGTVRLAKGSVEDFVQGVRISDLAGLIQADGNAIRIEQLAGRAGSGTVSIAGTVGLLQPDLPVSLSMTARRARLLASDLLTATTDADLTLRGDLFGTLTAGGAIRLASANINIPDSLPQSVSVLNVRRLGVKAPPPSVPLPAVGLALTIDAPEQVFVRGHGVDAEMGGRLKVGGTSGAPTIDGGFELRHGTFSLVGQTLSFTSGKVGFGGTGLTGRLDPTLDFVAQSTANNITATLTVTGYADAPKLQLSSAPDLPQDEILGRLLFGQSTQQLSPFQLAEVAQAAASFGGVGGGDPLGAIRGGLGLDRLSVGSASGGSTGATVEAGKYVANGVYVGAKQGTSGGSQAQVQIDLTKHFKVQTTLGTGGPPATGITPENDPGSSIGLTYGFDY